MTEPHRMLFRRDFRSRLPRPGRANWAARSRRQCLDRCCSHPALLDGQSDGCCGHMGRRISRKGEESRGDLGTGWERPLPDDKQPQAS